MVAETKGQRLIAWVKSGDSDTYLAVATEGSFDPDSRAVVLSAVPDGDIDNCQYGRDDPATKHAQG